MTQARAGVIFSHDEDNSYYAVILASIHNETAVAPGMFTLLPDDNVWTFIKGVKRCSLTFWCEYPEGPHPLCPIGSGGEGEYKVTFTREWLGKIAPYVSWTAKALKIALPIAGSIIKAGADEILSSVVKSQLDLMETCVRALPDGELSAEGGVFKPSGFFKRAEGSELREFHDLVGKQIKDAHWGGLCRIATGTGDFVWLCGEHAKLYVPQLPVIDA